MGDLIKFKNKKMTELELIKKEIREKLKGAFGEAIKRKLSHRRPMSVSKDNKLSIVD